MQPDDVEERSRDAARLRALEGKLDAIRPTSASTPGAMGDKFNQANTAWRMVIELVAGLVLGFGIGYGLDWVFGTRPIFLVLFILAGFAAGVKTMMRTARELTEGPPGRPAGPDGGPASAMNTTDRVAGDDDDEDEGR